MAETLPLICVDEGGALPETLTAVQRRWAEANGFKGERGRLLPLPGEGGLDGFLFGLGGKADRPKLVTGLAAAALEAGDYRLEGDFGDPTLAALGFRLGAYRFDRYRQAKMPVRLETPKGASAEVDVLVGAAFLARDLINTPANDLGPEAFDREIRRFGEQHRMVVRAVVGDELLAQNFPMISLSPMNG